MPPAIPRCSAIGYAVSIWVASLHASRVRLLVLDSWIQVGVEEVDEQINRHDREGKEEIDPLYQRVVAIIEGIDHQPSQTRDGEHLLHDHRTADH